MLTRHKRRGQLVGMPSSVRLYTVQDVRAMPDDGLRYETIDGELFVTPAPGTRHQAVLRELVVALAAYVKRYSLGVLYFAPTDVVLGPLTLIEPDLLFVRESRRHLITDRELTGAPDLAVEILSPSTARTDRGRKRALYQNAGVAEYWVVDIEQRQVEVWRPGALQAVVHRGQMRWQPDGKFEALLLDLEELFAAE